MSSDDVRKQIEDVATEYDLAKKGYESDLNPEGPKYVARCECGWAASDYGESARSLIASLGSTHESKGHKECCGVAVHRVDADGSKEVIR